jgi:hypothetical protein
MWQDRLGVAQREGFSASPVSVDGKVFFTNDNGQTFVLRAGETFELLHVNDLGERTLASPALVDRRWYIRTEAHLISTPAAGHRSHAMSQILRSARPAEYAGSARVIESRRPDRVDVRADREVAHSGARFATAGAWAAPPAVRQAGGIAARWRILEDVMDISTIDTSVPRELIT